MKRTAEAVKPAPIGAKHAAPDFVAHANGSEPALPAPKAKRAAKIKLQNLDDVRREMNRVYRAMKGGAIEPSMGTKLVYVLGERVKLEMVIEYRKRIESIERQLASRGSDEEVELIDTDGSVIKQQGLLR